MEEIFCDDEVTVAAQKAFGIKYFYPWQRIVIENIMDAARGMLDDECEDGAFSDRIYRGHQIVLLPTGAGKSLCFLAPALLLDGPTLVIYPLLALMADQKRRMEEGSLEAVLFRGEQTVDEREENFRRIKNGAKIILANPEVLQNKSLVERLSKCNIKHIAIDEAHCVSEWGDTFRKSYLTLGQIIKDLGVKIVTAFTATASPTVLARVSEVLFGGSVHIVQSDFDRPNIHYNVINAYDKKRAAFRLAVIEEKPLLIFCGTRAKSEDMAREISTFYGRDRVRFYHAGLEKEEKTATEKWFYGKDDAILCCTCAYGMGVDKKNIHTVIHLESPDNAEAYIQESGRAARDGSIGKAILLWSPLDSKRFGEFDENSRGRVMKNFAESLSCRRQVLLDALGGENVVCDGCDVCERQKSADFPWDADLVLWFLSRHRRMFDKNQLVNECVKVFNSLDSIRFGMCIWNAEDVELIVDYLLKEKLVRSCLWPWFGKMDCSISRRGRKQLSPIFYTDIWKKIQVTEKSISRWPWSFKNKITELLQKQKTG